MVAPRTLVVRGPSDALAPWHALLDAAPLHSTLTLFVPVEAGDLPPPLAKPVGAAVNAWLCEGMTCRAPIASPGELRAALDLPTMPAPRSSAPSTVSRSP